MTDISKYVFGKKVTAQSGWSAPGDWIDISNVNDNEINLLVGDFGVPTIAFACTIASSGTYDVSWGDGTVTTGCASTVTQQHSYTPGAGQSCSLGYTTFKIRIYGASGNITAFSMKTHTVSTQTQYPPLLWAVFGTTALTTLASAFFPSAYCLSLQCVVLPATLNSLTSLSATFRGCYSLLSVTLPTSMTALTTLYQAFYACYALQTIILPDNLSNLTTTGFQNAFYGCYSLQKVTLPTTIGAVTNCSSMFYSCTNLKSITLPALTSATLLTSAFQYASALATITGLDTLGSTTSNVDGTTLGQNCEMASGALTFGAKFTKFDWYGASGKLNKCTGIRLTNANSPFTGASPQIKVDYCSMDATALNTLFGDLPIVAAGQVIVVTGNPGAATCNTAIATGKGWTVTT